VQQQSEFTKRASQIGLSIHKTSLKLQKLAQLAKRTSMFDDPSAEIEEMTGVIKHDIQLLNEGIAELQRLSARGGEAANRQSAEHSHTVVDSLRTRLKDATAEFKDVSC
jgi:syntaxin 5